MSETESLMLEVLKQLQHDIGLIKQDVRDIKAQGISTHHRMAALDSDNSRQDESNLYIQDRIKRLKIAWKLIPRASIFQRSVATLHATSLR